MLIYKENSVKSEEKCLICGLSLSLCWSGVRSCSAPPCGRSWRIFLWRRTTSGSCRGNAAGIRATAVTFRLWRRCVTLVCLMFEGLTESCRPSGASAWPPTLCCSSLCSVWRRCPGTLHLCVSTLTSHTSQLVVWGQYWKDQFTLKPSSPPSTLIDIKHHHSLIMKLFTC